MTHLFSTPDRLWYRAHVEPDSRSLRWSCSTFSLRPDECSDTCDISTNACDNLCFAALSRSNVATEAAMRLATGCISRALPTPRSAGPRPSSSSSSSSSSPKRRPRLGTPAPPLEAPPLADLAEILTVPTISPLTSMKAVALARCDADSSGDGATLAAVASLGEKSMDTTRSRAAPMGPSRHSFVNAGSVASRLISEWGTLLRTNLLSTSRAYKTFSVRARARETCAPAMFFARVAASSSSSLATSRKRASSMSRPAATSGATISLNPMSTSCAYRRRSAAAWSCVIGECVKDTRMTARH